MPLNLLRIQDRPGLFSGFAGVPPHRSTPSLKVVLVVQRLRRRRRARGATCSPPAAFSLVLLPTLLRDARAALSRPCCARCLHFGLPKVPHGLLVQVQNLADRKILDLFVTRAEVGLYQMGYTLRPGR